jgi:hypothetical protein
MHDIRFKTVQNFGQQTRYRQHHREIAAVEVLDRRNPHHIDFIGRRVVELRSHHQNTVATAPVFERKSLYRARHAADVRTVGIGEHNDVHMCRPLTDVAPAAVTAAPGQTDLHRRRDAMPRGAPGDVTCCAARFRCPRRLVSIDTVPNEVGAGPKHIGSSGLQPPRLTPEASTRRSPPRARSSCAASAATPPPPTRVGRRPCNRRAAR